MLPNPEAEFVGYFQKKLFSGIKNQNNPRPILGSPNPNNENVTFMKTTTLAKIHLAFTLISFLFLSACTQEQQNKIGRGIQNWTGTDGILEVYAGDKLVRRFLKIDKLSTALGTDDGKPREYRFGYGYLDENLNMQVDQNEKKVYFEFSNYSNTVFFENPN
jgi:hypothetical protein